MHRLLCIFTLVFVTACAGPQTRMDEEGTYSFLGEPFSVAAPQACIGDMSIRDSRASVRFTSRRGGWKAAGDYSVSIYGLPENVRDEASFHSAVRNVYFQSVESAGNRVISGDDTQVNDRPAFQGISTDDSEAVVVSTNILFPNHIVMVQLLYPWDPENQAEPEVPWACYQEFIQSIRYQ
ncbi:hypothetical protein [Marinimicrobium sp. ABcell2]|uniref:hypothetical protein n=1 Tax=Marinimicrobium sp. ABcell2 TaxID=3069751 RepID=UPI0027B16690|nr:hypothetical protein [Marinimicrobium sp. ABcell2]MDQ2075198.1 hypothetical protein [Marinimicrobium sp. ABcell2]